jgi:membrane-bound lytic murein transglycosylase D
MIHGGWRRAPGGSDDPARRAAVVVAVLTTGLFAVGVVRVGISLSRTAERSGTPEPLALPVIPLEFEGVSLETYLAAWVPDSQRDELLRSPVLRDPDFARRVHWWMRYWTGPASGWFPDFLARMAWLGGTVDSTLAVRDLPPSLRYLPLIESGYAPGVTSHASAVGLWQLMGPTARGLGLEVGPMVDERRSWERSTEAALTYLEDLREEFDSWFLALAAYNTGPTRVRRILRRHAPDAPRSDSLFWALRDQFAPETRDFMPKLYGAMWVASRPDAYGFELPSVEPLTFDTVSVPDRTPLDVVARAAGVPHDEILRLNPEFVQGITPGGGGVVVRLPRGRRGVFASAYARIPTSEEAGLVESATETTPQPQATPPS